MPGQSRKRKGGHGTSQRSTKMPKGRGGAMAKPRTEADLDDPYFGADDSDLEEPMSMFDRLDDDEKKKDSDLDEDEEDSSDEDDFANETAQERRLRLAKGVLQRFDLDKPLSDSDSDENDIKDYDDVLGSRLQKDSLKARGKYRKFIADKYITRTIDASCVRSYRGHRLPVTCVVATRDGRTAYTGSKDCTIIKWDLETGRKLHVFPRAIKGRKMPGHTQEVLALALSEDGKYLASGGRDKMVRIWDTRTNAQLKSFARHMDAVTCMVFDKSSSLYTGSLDRTINVWNTENLSYIQTLFGHSDAITSLDGLGRERCITSGQDKTLRVWKIAADAQLLYRGGVTGSLDCVSMLTGDHYIAGSQDGSISLWGSERKKAISVLRDAHPGKWINSVAAYKYTDVVASGSNDGVVKLWKWGTQRREKNKLIHMHSVPVPGHVNAMTFTNGGKLLLCGVGRDHRLGRWGGSTIDAFNGLVVVNLKGTGEERAPPEGYLMRDGTEAKQEENEDEDSEEEDEEEDDEEDEDEDEDDEEPQEKQAGGIEEDEDDEDDDDDSEDSEDSEEFEDSD